MPEKGKAPPRRGFLKGSPEIGGWNPALVFGVAVTAAVVVIGWMWTGRPKRPMFGNFARDFVINFVIVASSWGAVACLALRLGEPWNGSRDWDWNRGRGSDCERDCEGRQAMAGAMKTAPDEHTHGLR